MSLTHYFFVPHSPLLIPEIGKEHRELMNETLKSLDIIHQQLKNIQPDTIIIVSPHAGVTTPTFNLNLSQNYQENLQEFGDLVTKNRWLPDIEFINHMRYHGHLLYDVNLITERNLDYGISIPLLCLTAEIPHINIVPITFAKLPLPEVYRFGQFLDKQCSLFNKNISIIASGDLSHRLTKESPSGYSPKAKAYDRQIVRAITKKNLSGLTKFSDTLLDEVGQCGIRSLLMLGGALDGKNYRPQLLSYEAPLGVGYLTASFDLV